ncbi:MBL fold metallo-hydrolase [Halobacterium jilantaiense]|uniref:Glyoxylase, beta-lactamase superfamily II n=1 Tax=Halobacterium jilantaiense TaxID=355548 RepID=A0A1I0P0D6_9EURY|nr:MBL fold metallo-hydrolase [Halobacterium jilantaiense]SEW07786.1 Glyoxylase, beta-lactamase superfamily II [Halobacterium jilantaiense]
MTAQLPPGVTHVDCSTLDMPNAYVVDDGETTLVDAGWPGDESTVRDGLRAADVEPGDVDRVLLTHSDADHVGTLARLTPELDAPVYVHEREVPYVAGDRLPPWTARNVVGALHRLYYRRLDLPDLPIRAVADGDTIGGFHAYHTPGHTPGHVAYVHEALSVAFLGDLVYGLGDRLKPTGWLTSHDAARVEDSVRTLCRRAPDFEYACPGHGPPLADGSNRLADALR